MHSRPFPMHNISQLLSPAHLFMTQHIDGFTANVVVKFFGFLPGEPSFWTYSAAATQIAGAALLGVGLLSRPTAAAMSGTMIAAVAFHLMNTGPEGFPLAVPTAHSYNFEVHACPAALSPTQKSCVPSFAILVCASEPYTSPSDPRSSLGAPTSARRNVRGHPAVLHGSRCGAVLRG